MPEISACGSGDYCPYFREFRLTKKEATQLLLYLSYEYIPAEMPELKEMVRRLRKYAEA